MQKGIKKGIHDLEKRGGTLKITWENKGEPSILSLIS